MNVPKLLSEDKRSLKLLDMGVYIGDGRSFHQIGRGHKVLQDRSKNNKNVMRG